LFWSQTVSLVRKIMKDFDIDAEQMAFYIYKCRPKDLNKSEFAKATFIPKILFKRFKLDELIDLYRSTYAIQDDGLAKATYQHMPETKTKTLLDLLKEIENEK